MKNHLVYVIIAGLVLSLSACKSKKASSEEETPPTDPGIGAIDANSTVTGYGILSHLPGIWNGPVVSPTALGSFPEWIVDFRPVSPSQVSSKSELDSVNNVLMGFFIVKHGNAYKMAFRNGGGFAGQQRIAYAVIDSVSETTNNYFYRFSDFRAGAKRVYTNVLFKDDSLIMHVYTNNKNLQTYTSTHMLWRAKMQDLTSTATASTNFSFPQKQMVKDFSTTFDTKPEAIYYNSSGDPYDETSQPYLGKTTVNISYGGTLTPVAGKNVFLMITTQTLFSGFTFLPAQLKFRSRYVFLASLHNKFTFSYMHPGKYYLYTLYDNNGDKTFSSGDWMSSNLTNTFTLGALGTKTVNTTIDFTIP